MCLLLCYCFRSRRLVVVGAQDDLGLRRGWQLTRQLGPVEVRGEHAVDVLGRAARNWSARTSLPRVSGPTRRPPAARASPCCGLTAPGP